MSLYERIREVVATIPSGKVLTYGDVARQVGTKDARIVGWALRGNQDKKVPCHRVIKAEGFIAKNYSLGNWEGQKRLLKAEGVKFIGKRQVDMRRHHFVVV